VIATATPEPSRPEQSKTSLPASATRLSLGRDFGCFVGARADVRCWGRNDLAQLGRGTRTEAETSPAPVSGIASVLSVTAGGTQACALDASGAVYCWGEDPTPVDDSARVRVTPARITGLASGIRSISSGTRHACALSKEGASLCFGFGSDGQLGNDASSPSAAPVETLGLTGLTSLSAGQLHTCAVTAKGVVTCWGSARFGRLGNGSSQQYAASNVPVDVVGLGAQAVSVVAGGDRTCALLVGGSVKCWGRVRPGRRLTEATPNEVEATAFDVKLPEPATSLAVGRAHSCAILASGAVTCWGWNENGQLGNGTKSDSEMPVKVEGLGGKARRIAAGEAFSCAELESSGLRCWGANAFGQLGNGTRDDATRPVTVTGMP
jgi:alpha-tubulin suppressor-like RCC1 family protein